MLSPDGKARDLDGQFTGIIAAMQKRRSL